VDGKEKGGVAVTVDIVWRERGIKCSGEKEGKKDDRFLCCREIKGSPSSCRRCQAGKKGSSAVAERNRERVIERQRHRWKEGGTEGRRLHKHQQLQ
jgi:hypothetical protein